jgi:hypothetical protein
MPRELPPSELVAAAAAGALWVHFDAAHHHLYCLQETDVVRTDTLTGAQLDRWPLDPDTMVDLGVEGAAVAAVRERISRGY